MIEQKEFNANKLGFGLMRLPRKGLNYGAVDEGKEMFEKAIEGKGKPSDCLACGKCQNACPQQLPIIEKLKECKANFE